MRVENLRFQRYTEYGKDSWLLNFDTDQPDSFVLRYERKDERGVAVADPLEEMREALCLSEQAVVVGPVTFGVDTPPRELTNVCVQVTDPYLEQYMVKEEKE